ncbi:MAG: transcriptional repressor [Spirochaetales bacterium]|nr:transcriptional repressor [Spirochaetales bacterium]
MRITKQKSEIMRTLQQATDHPTADMIYERVRKMLPSISLGTVYRNLERLVQKGKILRIPTGSQNRYDGNTESHAHFRCISCGCIEDIFFPETDTDFFAGLETGDRKITGIYLEYHGYCANCARKEKTMGNGM